MINYQKWPIKELKITGLKLDPQNPRIPQADEPLSQMELIAELVNHDDVFDLAKKISQQGFYPTETLVAVREEGSLWVVEGNRRLAALKLLHNADLAPAAQVARFKRLREHGLPTPISKARIVLAPSRDAAAPLIMSRHTGSEIEKWTPIMQARFYESLLERKMTVKDLADAYGGTQTDVMRYLRTGKIYRLARSLELPEKVRKLVDDPRAFPITNLTRLTETDKVQEFLGLKPDSKDIFQIVVAPEEFKKAFKKMVTDVAEEIVTSRTHNTGKEIDVYLRSFGPLRPNRKQTATVAADEVIGVPDVPKRQKPTLATKPASPTILPQGLRCQLDIARINELFRELHQLKLAKFPNASVIMLRSLLDMATSHYFDTNGHTKLLKDRLNKKGTSPRPPNWHPSLDQMFKYMLDDASVPLNPTARKVLAKLVSNPQSPLSLESMNGFVHNRYSTPTESELRSLSSMLQPVLELVLAPPAKP
jgi:predicted transcriptional regulator